MVNQPPARRMTLRQLLTHTEKCIRDLIEQTNTTLLGTITDFRDLSRPVRKKSHYPTLLALCNALNKLTQVNKETQTAADYLHARLQEIREHARRERTNRL
jgi:hypothetical protein